MSSVAVARDNSDHLEGLDWTDDLDRMDGLWRVKR